MNQKDKRFEFKLSAAEFDRLHTIASQRNVSAGSLLRRSIQRMKLRELSRERTVMPKPTPKPTPKPQGVAELTEEINEQDAEATRLLDSDPTYKRNIKTGEPLEDSK